jgi:hypothetical protein
LLCCSTLNGKSNEENDKLGLVPNHAYALLDAAEV